ncbi:TIGR01458 family HAD-type hydrolase [Sulfurimonas autotrophica]|uniref:Haloacid dehalogenase-like hydrolase domain-containing protein 2 n=1 Tax=Sulfurimonas autotrophica (strain ATCC BAA-671 / DSM 16294 / JCM 11897 / OK10) TaxID=563040 RepID=E0UUJ1_SULAO|nr:TIGR01458 family HAD-type hydrolase [Sulfurimonas autotrophica]ADN08427.1 HAD-superfamily subfamily IIA hydrolase like protein [Sulfurimonas autotrophica DSM 16294]
MFDESIKAVLCDIGGVLYVGDKPIEGAVEAVKEIKKHYPIRFLTNTTQRTSAQVVKKLQKMGFEITSNEIITALDVTKMFLEKEKSFAEFLLTDDALCFFDDLKYYEEKYVVVGDAQDNFNYKNLNCAFRKLMDGASLLGIAKNRYFKDSDNELSMDAGCFVSALEYGSGQEASLIGKPSREFYHLACASLHVSPNECVMIGDDIESDIKGAQEAGIQAALVKTGKFSKIDLSFGIKPDYIFESIAAIL